MVYTTNNPTYKNDGLGAGLLLLFYPHSGNPVQMDVNLGYPLHFRKPPFVDTPGEADRVNG